MLNFRFALRKEMSTLIGSDNHKVGWCRFCFCFCFVWSGVSCAVNVEDETSEAGQQGGRVWRGMEIGW